MKPRRSTIGESQSKAAHLNFTIHPTTTQSWKDFWIFTRPDSRVVNSWLLSLFLNHQIFVSCQRDYQCLAQTAWYIFLLKTTFLSSNSAAIYITRRMLYHFCLQICIYIYICICNGGIGLICRAKFESLRVGKFYWPKFTRGATISRKLLLITRTWLKCRGDGNQLKY